MTTVSNEKRPSNSRGTPAATSATLPRSHNDGVIAHGVTRVSRLVSNDEAADLLLRAAWLPRVLLDVRTSADAELIATGALSPLDGFLRRDDYYSVVRDARLVSGVPFPIPITLSVPRAARADCREGGEVALIDASGQSIGVLAIDEIYELDRDLEAKEVYGTTDAKHPGVAYLYAHRDVVALGGRLTLAAGIESGIESGIEQRVPASFVARHAGEREAWMLSIISQNRGL